MRLKIIDLKQLPAGASFHTASGRVHQTVIKTDQDELNFVSTCDSLLLLVESINKEVYHLSKENTALKTQLNERKEVIVREPSGWQWFQIYAGRILIILLTAYLILRFVFKEKL